MLFSKTFIDQSIGLSELKKEKEQGKAQIFTILLRRNKSRNCNTLTTLHGYKQRKAMANVSTMSEIPKSHI